LCGWNASTTAAAASALSQDAGRHRHRRRGGRGRPSAKRQYSAQSALAILNKGGNAVDRRRRDHQRTATLGVTDPFSCGIGGGGFMVIYLAKDKRVITIDHRETAPASRSRPPCSWRTARIDFDTASPAAPSVGVPGTVRGWHEALERYGTMSFKQVLAPAIDVATEGFKVSETFRI
jgi:gamma-glutamyltranspeptidase/glutathione hydrolase